VAATADEVEDALGPLASRSRVREVLNALQATRQLTMLSVGRSSAYALVGGSAEILAVVAEKRDHDELKKQRAEAKAAAGSGPREFGERKQWAKDRGIAARTRPRSDKPEAGESAGRERKEWKPRPEGSGGAGFAARKPYVKRDSGGEKREYKPRTFAASAERKPFAKRDRNEPRKPFVKREGGDFKPRTFSDRPAGEKREWKPRQEGAGGSEFAARKPFAKRDGDAARKPFVKREGGSFKPRTFSDRPAGERKEWKPRASGAASGGVGKPFARKPFVKRDAGDPPARKPFAARQAASYPPRAPRPDRPAGERREWKDRPTAGTGAGERKPFAKRESAGDKRFDRKPGSFAKKPGGFAKKPGGFAKKPGGFGARKPFGGSAPVKRAYKRKEEE
jgi:23S rRNA pseudouridine2605 synthase